MKNGLIIWNGILTLAVAVLGYLHFKGNTAEGATATTINAGKGKKIVYVQADSLLKNYEYYKDFQKEFESKGFQLESDLGNRARSFQNEVAFFQQKAQQGGLTQEQGQSVQAQLAKKEQEIGQYRDTQLRKLEGERLKKTEEFYTGIFEYIKRYNKENAYELVLGYSKGGGILFADQSLDVTQKILNGLNKEYKEKQAAVPATPKK
ncbi:MAG: OmpH family outer membrane protein [Cytophagia bacterium]|nr:MAG: OmpH family outer membrane protein [Runella sp.]TAG22931.1 MAG: OmpH family outer membrane protein [Cytophagales bacterium]TAG41986.1 MAG: OmpH family outer membrane protein [Cytophagia bacterium]TAG56976.1 MAG: OmpH family outer membrane protein [Runella slithyformis]TAG82440.1 MAG: OmpH family outer membrane protein [Cytophagales bacterium]